MKPDLPESLHPLASNHPAGCAWRILLSPEEWTWTQAEAEAMARAVVALNTERIALREDKARIDHLASMAGGWPTYCDGWHTSHGAFDTLRAAIDSTRKEAKFCSDCEKPVGEKGPRDGWQMEDGRTVCHACCIKDTRDVVRSAIDAARKEAKP